jgi:hypothetical protein
LVKLISILLYMLEKQLDLNPWLRNKFWKMILLELVN